MARWIFEPGHTAAEFCVRHMMVTWVRGHFKNIQGRMDFDPEDPARASVEATIDARGLWTGAPDRDAHLKSSDFLDVEHYPAIAFRGRLVEQTGCSQFKVTGDLTMRGVTKPVILDVQYLGQWRTPYWEGGVNKGATRAGFLATGSINRHDFGVSWNDTMDKGGIVVGNEVQITLDVEALLETS
jgi:polyisoprenoid-binding protein YceI